MENSIIGDKIAKARKKASFSQAQLAEQLFISPQAVGKWERGESIPDIVTINRLARILDVELNYFSEDPLVSGEGVASQNASSNNDLEAGKNKEGDHSRSDRQLLTNFSGSALSGSDFAGVTAHKRKFNGTVLRGSDFSGADLAGSSFNGSDIRAAKFDGSNLSDCTFHATDLSGTSFKKSILQRTEFSATNLTGARFTDAKLIDVKLTAMDLRKTTFENCTFRGVDFKASDLSGLSLGGLTFTDVKFDDSALKDTSFKGAILNNVSFRPTFALTNKYYRAIKTICFEGSTMDKLTYAALKGIGADLSQVTVR